MGAAVEKSYKTKRLLSYIMASVYLFIGGCEYAVIFPTCWDYIQSLGVTEEYWLGFTFSVYSLAAAVSGVLGGRLADVYANHTKTIVLVSVLINAIGNFQYSIGITVWNIVSSRFLCGLGQAAGSAMLAEICRTTTLEERTPVLAVCNATRQIGILVAPAFQLILAYFNFSLFGLPVHPLNAPGIFMAFFWMIFEFSTCFLYFNLTAELQKLKEQSAERPTVVPYAPRTRTRSRKVSLSVSNYGTIIENAVHEGESEEPSEDATTMAKSGRARRKRNVSFSESLMSSVAISQGIAGRRNMDGDILQEGPPPAATYETYINEFLNDTFVVLTFTVFVQFFTIVAVETIIPVIVQNYFGYGSFAISLIFMAGGFEAVTVFFGVAYVSRWVRDTTLQMIGWVLMIVPLTWLLFTIPIYEKGNSVHFAYFMIGFVTLYLGYSIQSVSNNGIGSKLLSDETQGLGQGLRRLASYLGLIYGPLWSGATIKYPVWCLGVPIGLVATNGIMLGISHRRLHEEEDRISEISKAAEKAADADKENDPLLQP